MPEVSLSTEQSLVLPQKAEPTPTTPKLLYDRRSASHALSISLRSLDYLISGRQLATRRLGKKIMISHETLVKFCRGDHFELTQPASKATVM
jgi:hypothetical protein